MLEVMDYPQYRQTNCVITILYHLIIVDLVQYEIFHAKVWDIWQELYNKINSLATRKQTTKFSSANFKKNVKSKLYHIENPKHEGQLSVTGESMCTKYWLTA